ncbi:MAG: MIP family channel protein [Acidobacteria bacterium]|nr:MIP family channel protein [Acidobacteriota bacterium]
MREALAEFFGTTILLTFGLGVVAQTVLSSGGAGSPLSIHLCWGIAVILGVYASAGVSGGHLNPAVTLALALRRGFPWNRVGPYVIAQVLGAFAGATIVYLTYHEAFAAFDGGVRQIAGAQGTAGIFATYPAAYLSTFGGFIDQVVGTALLVAAVFALTDSQNAPPQAGLVPVLVGVTVMGIGMAFGVNAGYAINPARDFGPRLFTALAGWGPGVFTAANSYFWVPIIAPCVGAVLGGTLYDLCITQRRQA